MASTQGALFLKSKGVEFTLHPFAHDPNADAVRVPGAKAVALTACGTKIFRRKILVSVVLAMQIAPGGIPGVRSPMTFSGANLALDRPAPKLGQDD